MLYCNQFPLIRDELGRIEHHGSGGLNQIESKRPNDLLWVGYIEITDLRRLLKYETKEDKSTYRVYPTYKSEIRLLQQIRAWTLNSDSRVPQISELRVNQGHEPRNLGIMSPHLAYKYIGLIPLCSR